MIAQVHRSADEPDLVLVCDMAGRQVFFGRMPERILRRLHGDRAAVTNFNNWSRAILDLWETNGWMGASSEYGFTAVPLPARMSKRAGRGR